MYIFWGGGALGLKRLHDLRARVANCKLFLDQKYTWSQFLLDCSLFRYLLISSTKYFVLILFLFFFPLQNDEHLNIAAHMICICFALLFCDVEIKPI